MTIEEIKNIIEGIGPPATYYAWPEDDPLHPVPPLPYIVWYLPQTDNFAADDTVYQKISAVNVELYTAYKDFALEEQVEDTLTGAFLFWNKSESYLDKEHMFEALYETGTIITPDAPETPATQTNEKEDAINGE